MTSPAAGDREFRSPAEAAAWLTRRGLLAVGFAPDVLANGQDDVLGTLRNPRDVEALVYLVNTIAATETGHADPR